MHSHLGTAPLASGSRTLFVLLALLAVIGFLFAGCQGRTGGGGSPSGTQAGPSTVTWSKTFGNPGVDQARGVVAASDGTFLVSGQGPDFGAGNQLIHVDGAGDSLWKQRWQTGVRVPGLETVAGYGPTPDGGYIAFGFRAIGTDTVVVIKVSEDGQLGWRASLPGFRTFTQMAVGPMGEACLAQQNDAGFVEAVVLEPNGTERWRQVFPNLELSESAQLGSVTATLAGNFIVAGRVSNEETIFAHLAGGDGDVAWANTFTHGEHVFLRYHEFRVIDPSTWSIAIWRQVKGTADNVEIFVRGSIADGSILDSQEIVEPANVTFHWGARLANGDRLLCGSQTAAGSGGTPMVFRYDAAGAQLWSQSVSDPGWAAGATGSIAHCHELDTGELVLRGSVRESFTNEVFVARLDPAGSVQQLFQKFDPPAVAVNARADSPNHGDSYLIAGSVEPGSGGGTTGGGPWLLKLDAMLQPAWERAWIPSTTESVGGATENLAGDGFVVCGGSYEYGRETGHPLQAVIFELESSGLVRWAVSPGYPFPNEAVDVISVDDRYCAILRGRVTTGQDVCCVVEIAVDGTILADRVFAISEDAPTRIAATASAYWIVLEDLTDYSILRVSRDLSNFEALEVDWVGIFEPHGLAATDDRFAIAASTGGVLGVAVFADDGSGVWTREHDFGPAESVGNDVSFGPDGSVMVAGTFEDVTLGAGDDLWLVRFDASGDVVHQTRYASAAREQGVRVSASANGFAVISGESELLSGDPSDPDQWVLHVDSNGEVSSTCPSGVGVPTTETFTARNAPLVADDPITLRPETVSPLSARILYDDLPEFLETSQCIGVGTPTTTPVDIELIGEGIVSSAVPGFECSQTCTVEVPLGTLLDLDASAAAGWTFASWGGAYGGVPIEVTGPLTIQVTFVESVGSGDPITISDGTFAEPDWESSEVSSFGDANELAYQMPGADPYRAMFDELPAGSGVNQRHVYTAFTYDPQASGAITALDVSEQHRVFGLGPGGMFPPALLLNVNFVLVQDGRTHWLATGATPVTQEDVWTTITWTGLTAMDFTAVGGVFPDFSASGAPIQFGYLRSSLNDTVEYQSIEHGIDDWSVTIHR